MPDCTPFGVPGTHVPLPELLTTSGSLTCFISGYLQTADSVFVKVFASSSPATAIATISGSGRGGAPTALSTAVFEIMPGETYFASIEVAGGGQIPRVLAAYDALSYGTTTYAGGYTLCSENSPTGGDCDFNDCLVNINWTLHRG
jgi:hypothetical protein